MDESSNSNGRASINALVRRLKAMADHGRLRLLALCRHGECSVSELAAVLGQSQPRISQQLKQLCDAGLLNRFRDGKRVFYRVGRQHGADVAMRQMLQLIPQQQNELAEDLQRLRALRGDRLLVEAGKPVDASADRAVYRALIELTVTAPVGDLLDIGCGRGSLLKLLSARANRAVGVDIDADARQLARAELMLAGIPGASLRKGDMYRLAFGDAEFDTIILDDVLADATQPVDALREARRLLNPGGRLFILSSVRPSTAAGLRKSLAQWSGNAGLRLAPARLVPSAKPVWMLAVATHADSESEAA